MNNQKCKPEDTKQHEGRVVPHHRLQCRGRIPENELCLHFYFLIKACKGNLSASLALSPRRCRPEEHRLHQKASGKGFACTSSNTGALGLYFNEAASLSDEVVNSRVFRASPMAMPLAVPENSRFICSSPQENPDSFATTATFMAFFSLVVGSVNHHLIM